MSDAVAASAQDLRIALDAQSSVSGILGRPPSARACLVLAHGAGAGMTHPFMAAVADGLAGRGVATLRYQFPYMEAGSRRPDRPSIAHAAVRAAVETAARHAPQLPLFAGGKSFGARMTSQAQAESALPGVRGLFFFGFPLHPAKKPSTDRADHLDAVCVPMLFLQGTRDALAEMPLLMPRIARLAPRATLVAIDGADHSFHVPARSGRTDTEVMDGLLDDVVAWIDQTLATENG